MVFQKKIWLLFVVLLGGQLNLSAQTDSIPEFTLYYNDSATFTKKDLASDKLLFFLFFDVKCIHCRHATEALNEKYSQMANTNIYLITMDHPEEVQGFLSRYGSNLLNKSNVKLLYDSRHQFIIRFKPRKFPSIFLFSPNGRLIKYDDNPANLPKFFDEIKSWPKN